MEETLDFNETNKLRLKLGLKPLNQSPSKSISNSTLSNSTLSNSTLSKSISNSTLSNSTLSNSTLSKSISNSTLSKSTSKSTSNSTSNCNDMNDINDAIVLRRVKGNSACISDAILVFEDSNVLENTESCLFQVENPSSESFSLDSNGNLDPFDEILPADSTKNYSSLETNYSLQQDYHIPLKKRRLQKTLPKQPPLDSHSISVPCSNSSSNIQSTNFVDDDDLQSFLSRSRNVILKQKNNTILSLPESSIVDSESNPGLILSSTTEFVNNLNTDIDNDPPEATSNDSIVQDSDFKSGHDSQDLNCIPDIPENTPVDSLMDIDQESNDDIGLEDEPIASSSLSATLSLLKKKGMIEPMTDSQRARETTQKAKMKWQQDSKNLQKAIHLQNTRKKIDQKIVNKSKGKQGFSKESDLLNSLGNKALESERIMILQERFKDYTPDIQLKYTDEYGRSLTPKEAFRQLSHSFHGKKSGKLKTEKRLLKIEQEIGSKKMTSTDTPLGIVEALKTRARDLGSAGVVIGVGNRGVVPRDVIVEEEARAAVKKEKKVFENVAKLNF